MNFGFDGSNTEPMSVDPLASKSEGKGPDKGKGPSFVLEKRTQSSEAVTNICPKKIKEKGPIQVHKSSIIKSPPGSSKRHLAVILTSSAIASTKEPREIGSSPFSQVKFPKGTQTGFYWKEGLPTNFPDSVGVYLPGRSTIMKSRDERSTSSDLGKYAREAVCVFEPPYFTHNIEDVPATLTTAMGNIFEVFSLMGRVRDDYAAHEGKVTFPKIQSNDVSKAIIERDYWKGKVTEINRDLGLLKGENSQIKQAQKLKEESAKAIEEASQRAAAAEA
jgi:hypothetical protein